MRKLTLMALITLPIAWLPPADAQIFGRKPKTPPEQRVAELIFQAKADPDEHKRTAAAEELREFDGKAFPQIVPTLVDIARSDPKAGVRLEAVSSLAKIRPVSQAAGQTLEWSAAHDDAWKVRWHAKSSLMRYQLAGYHAGKSDANATKAALPPATQEPPLLDSRDNKGVRPSTNPAIVNRTTAPKTFAPQVNAPKNVPAPTPPPVIGTEPPLPKVVVDSTPQAPPVPTPPPLIVEAPPAVKQPAVPPVPVPVPAVVIEPAPKLGPPTVPTTAPPAAVTEPNFRPAGQTPPRTPPPPKTEERGPTLTVPM